MEEGRGGGRPRHGLEYSTCLLHEATEPCPLLLKLLSVLLLLLPCSLLEPGCLFCLIQSCRPGCCLGLLAILLTLLDSDLSPQPGGDFQGRSMVAWPEEPDRAGDGQEEAESGPVDYNTARLEREGCDYISC